MADLLDTAIFGTLEQLVDGRCYPDTAPDKAIAPYIVYVEIAGAPENTLADGQPINQIRLQVDFFAKSHDSVKELALAGMAALTGSSLNALQVLDGAGYEPAVKLYRRTHDYSIWISR